MFRQLTQILARCATSSCSSSTSSSAFSPLRSSGGPPPLRCNSSSSNNFFSTSASGGSESSTGRTVHSVLETAAEHRMTRLKATQDATGSEDQVNSTAPRSPLKMLLGLLGRTILVGGTVSALAASYYTYRYDLEELTTIVEETKAKKENSFLGSGMWVQAMEWYIPNRASVEKQIKSFRDPTCDRLLPDLRPEMKSMGIKTLVLDLNDVLVSKHWTRQKGWTLYKRPGAQDFLQEMGQYFEIVIFTDEPSSYAMPVISKLDKQQCVPYRLFRPETQYHEGKHVRDLSKLNRDLSQVLFISANPSAYMFQPENTLKLKPWKDDPGDTTLLDLIPMLQMIALKGVKDVRDVVRSYEGEEDVAKAFKKRMQKVSQPKVQPGKPARGILSFK